MSWRPPLWAWIVGAVVCVLLVVGVVAWYRLLREVPQTFDNPEEMYKYGSIGVENDQGIPYRIWQVLPQLFPEYLPRPGGYEAFGLLQEPGHDTPVGIPKKVIGFERVGINCAVCHSGSFRTDPQQTPTIVPTAPATRLDIESYFRFFFQVAADPRFTPDYLLPAMRQAGPLDPLDEALYRFLIIPATRDGLLKQRDSFNWTDSRPAWGAGRIDPFNPVKFNQLQMDPSTDNTIGNSDMEPLWNVQAQTGFGLHWDGLNNSVTEVALTGALGDGATKTSLPVSQVLSMMDWASTVQPPKYPYPVDQELAARGQPIFQQKCADCHAYGGSRTGTVIPRAEIGTDPHRLDMWSQEAADRYNAYAADTSYKFTHFVKQDGYVAVPLDGIWLRAPYLHNGSVPTLEELLKPASQRTTDFWRGYDVYDQQQTGFVSQGADAERFGWHVDTTVAGNGNAGHEGDAYGTMLSDADKRALVEYLKTL
ncbi:MAG: cytochrome c [Chloroflexi bacterium]|nr:cytochrome c [Chloroflexota bacterium]